MVDSLTLAEYAGPEQATQCWSSHTPAPLLQPALVLLLRPAAPALAALHTLNALLIFSLAFVVAQRTRPGA